MVMLKAMAEADTKAFNTGGETKKVNKKRGMANTGTSCIKTKRILRKYTWN